MIYELATNSEIDCARRLYAEDDVQIDEGALASRGEDGVWVQAWVLIPHQDE